MKKKQLWKFALLGMLTFAAAGCAVAPTVTDSDDIKPVPAGYEAVSLCYNGGQESKLAAEKLALAECPEGTKNLHFWEDNVIMNQCPVLKWRRVTFLCAKPE